MLSEMGVIREINRIERQLKRRDLPKEKRTRLHGAYRALCWACYQGYSRPSEWFGKDSLQEDAQVEQSNSQR